MKVLQSLSLSLSLYLNNSMNKESRQSETETETKTATDAVFIVFCKSNKNFNNAKERGKCDFLISY